MRLFNPKKTVLLSLLLVILLIGCNTDSPTPTAVSEQIPQATDTAAPTATPSATAQPTATPTATDTPTPAPTATAASTPTPRPTNTPTPHPLANVNGRIIFSSFQSDQSADIFLMNPDGSEMQQLTDDAFFDFGPQVSPDGQTIVFASDRDGDYLQLYLMNIDSGDIVRLTESEGHDRDPQWSANGSQITFASDRDGDPEISVINIDGSDERQLTDNDTTDVSPIWSPNGEWIAFSSSQDAEDPNIFLIRPDGSELTRVTLSPNYDGDAVSWSPDSEWLIIPAQRIGNYELYALRLEDRLFGPLTHTEGNEYSGFLSADGRYLLINAFYDDYNGLILQDLTTGETTQLTPDATANFAAWQPEPATVFDPSWLEQAILTDETCVYSEDETYGYTAENPIPIGNGPNFGGPFDGFDLYTYVRGSTDAAQTWMRGHTFPSNSQNDILDTLLIAPENGPTITLYVSINDYSIPEIPVGMYCDLEYP